MAISVAAHQILRPTQPLAIGDALVLSDFDAASAFAWEQDDDGTTSWNDLRSKLLAPLREAHRGRPELAPFAKHHYAWSRSSPRSLTAAARAEDGIN